jgi:cytochrome c-type biogenesis protein CcmH
MNAASIRVAVLSLALGLFAQIGHAVEPGEMLADPVLEARARALSTGLRCLVCRNQNIDDSNAELARDLRVLLRERLSAGATDEEAVAYLVDRYGNFILLNPPINAATWLLWASPGLLLIFAVWGFASVLRRKPEASGPQDLTDDDKAIVARALALETKE